MEIVNATLKTKHNTYKEYEFVFEDEFDYNTLFLKIIKQAKEEDYLKDLYIYDYNSNDYVELLEWLEIDNSNYDGIDKLMDEYNFYYLDLSDLHTEHEGIYLIDIDHFKIEVKGEN
jgi:hypothetical protein